MISTSSTFVHCNITAPQQHIRPQSQSPELSHVMPPSSDPIQFTCPLSPSRFHPPGARCIATPVDEMTVHQTANWIRTMGGYYGWAQVEEYAESFIYNSISGVLLDNLTQLMLEDCLGIKDHCHQRQLLNEIERLYPNRRLRNTLLLQESSRGIQVVESSYNNANSLGHCQAETEYDSGYESTNLYSISNQFKNAAKIVHTDYSDLMSVSGYSQRTSAINYMESDCDTKTCESSTENLSITHYSRYNRDTVMCDRGTREDSKTVAPLKVCEPMRCRKLLLVLGQNDVEQGFCSLQSIRNRFQELEIQVEVVPNENKHNTYTLVFPNYQRAEEILSRAKEIGYKMTKKWPPRPNPKCPQKFQSMAKLEIRAGKSLRRNIVGYLKVGDIVMVNQVKGRRARLIRDSKNGGVETRGWVSLHEQDGINLLKQVGDF